MNDIPSESPPTFDVLPLSAELRRAIDELGYTHPTPVQRAVFEPAARGRDLVVQARTGTGKTAAFGMPLVDSVIRRQIPAVQVLVLCPTRELALQVTREVEVLGRHRGVKAVAVYGGAPMPRQVQQIRDGAQLLVGTPGRVLDHLRRKTLDPSALRAVVLDESDEMLSMGFLPQINAIFAALPEQRQTLLFSATLPPDIRRLAETKLKDPEFVTLSGDQIGALEIDHFVYLTLGDKADDLLRIIEIENPESAIIFCNTRDDTKRVASVLSQQGFSADWLNADLSQSDREKVMAATRGGELRFLVATDVAARGIDISHLTHVINYDFPESAEGYVHRTGRTGRAGRTGTAISLITPANLGNLYLLRLTYKIRPIERSLPSQRERQTREQTDLVDMFVRAFGVRTPHPDDLNLARRLFTHEQAEVIVAALLRDHLGARPDAIEEARAARRAGRARPETEAETAPARGRSDRDRSDRDRSDRDRSDRGDRHRDGSVKAEHHGRDHSRDERSEPDAPPSEAPPSEAPPDDLPVAEIYVNVGRADGAKPSDIHAALKERGLPDDQIQYVRVRHRHTFVGIAPELFDTALAALNGATIAGRHAQAEAARARA